VTGSQWASPKNRFKVTTVTASGTATSVREPTRIASAVGSFRKSSRTAPALLGVLCRTGRGVSRRHGGWMFYNKTYAGDGHDQDATIVSLVRNFPSASSSARSNEMVNEESRSRQAFFAAPSRLREGVRDLLAIESSVIIRVALKKSYFDTVAFDVCPLSCSVLFLDWLLPVRLPTLGLVSL
jgi:hypothetical protein